MSIAAIVSNFATGITIVWGIADLKDDQFNPMYLFFHLAIIIAIGVIVGFIAEACFINLKKYYNDRLGRGHL